MTLKRVIGLGGIFFKAKDSKALGEWYAKYLGVPVEPWGGVTWKPEAMLESGKDGYNLLTFFKADTKYLEPSQQPFMINLIVDDLSALVVALHQEGVDVMGEVQESEYGKFSWVMDPEGNKVELWEPPKK